LGGHLCERGDCKKSNFEILSKRVHDEQQQGHFRAQSAVLVDIKRSNGQTQSGVVSEINHQTRTVTVILQTQCAIVLEINHETRTVTATWSEEREIKGKELSLEDLLALNPQLAHLNEPANASQQPTKQESLELPQPDQITELVDSHCNLNVQIGQWVNDNASLLATTTKDDFDQNTYWNTPGAMFNGWIEALWTMQE